MIEVAVLAHGKSVVDFECLQQLAQLYSMIWYMV